LKTSLIIIVGALILLNYFVIPKEFVEFVWILICGLLAVESYLDYRSDGKRLNLYAAIGLAVATLFWLSSIIFPG